MINKRNIILFLSLSFLLLVIGHLFYMNTSDILEIIIEPSTFNPTPQDPSTNVPSIKITLVKRKP